MRNEKGKEKWEMRNEKRKVKKEKGFTNEQWAINNDKVRRTWWEK